MQAFGWCVLLSNGAYARANPLVLFCTNLTAMWRHLLKLCSGCGECAKRRKKQERARGSDNKGARVCMRVSIEGRGGGGGGVGGVKLCCYKSLPCTMQSLKNVGTLSTRPPTPANATVSMCALSCARLRPPPRSACQYGSVSRTCL
jgi:hypothetical protein